MTNILSISSKLDIPRCSLKMIFFQIEIEKEFRVIMMKKKRCQIQNHIKNNKMCAKMTPDQHLKSC